MSNQVKRIRNQLKKYEESNLLRLPRKIREKKNKESEMSKLISNSLSLGWNQSFIRDSEKLEKNMKNLKDILDKQPEPYKNDMMKLYDNIRRLMIYNKTYNIKTEKVMKEMKNMFEKIEKKYANLEKNHKRYKYTTLTENFLNNNNKSRTK
jgi:hypothetical protein